jgi:hypothetical protein
LATQFARHLNFTTCLIRSIDISLKQHERASKRSRRAGSCS